MGIKYEHLISFRLNDYMLKQLDSTSKELGQSYSDTLRLSLTLLFARELKNKRNTCNTRI